MNLSEWARCNYKDIVYPQLSEIYYKVLFAIVVLFSPPKISVSSVWKYENDQNTVLFAVLFCT